MSDPRQKTIPFAAERIEWVINQSFGATLSNLGSTLKKPRLMKVALLVSFKRTTALKSYLEKTGGDIGLMILGTVSHGRLLGLFRGPAQSQMFLIGNPLIALTMMRIHPQAGVYAPLRVMLSGAGSNSTIITYDRPSKVFGQWSDAVFGEIGKRLDAKMDELIRRISG